MNDIIVNTTDIWQNVTTTFASSQLPLSFERLNVGVRIFEGFLAVITNSLTILAVFKYEFLRTNTNLLICSLAAADLLGGISPIFLLTHFNLRSDVHRWLIICTFEKGLSLLSPGLNLMSIMWVSVDRFMYINFPLRYYILVQRWHVWASIGISWLVCSAMIGIITLLGVQTSEDLGCRSEKLYLNQAVYSGFVNGLFGCCTIIILLLYSRIAFVAYKQARSIGFQMSGAGDAVSAFSKAEAKITKMMALVLGLYILCYTPQIVLMIFMRRLDNPPQWLSMGERVSSWIWWINSWMNPFIYAWKSPQFNRGFRLLLGLNTVHPSPLTQGTHTS